MTRISPRDTATARIKELGGEYFGTKFDGEFRTADDRQIDIRWTATGQIAYAKRWGARPGEDTEIRRHHKDKLATLIAWIEGKQQTS